MPPYRHTHPTVKDFRENPGYGHRVAGMSTTDPHRVEPDEHRGEDIGILDRLFELRRDRADDDHRGPRPLHRDYES